MTIPHYGVWVGQPTRYDAQTEQQDPKSPHIYLYFKDDQYSRKEPEAAINVKSTDKDTRLVYWFNRNFTHPILDQLASLDEGFHLLQSSEHRYRHYRHEESTSGLKGLDFLRTEGLVSIEAGTLLPSEETSDNDILDKLDPILTDAINQKATVYIFGSSYGSGIHDIHMNQGNSPSYDNGIYEDGALLFRFEDGHWESVFLAFASQEIPTNAKGLPEEGSKTLASILGE
ncbi:hypothetical protein BO70DRAFT_232876 [Aspergillus heteromorphus CBS 117.55]|uniref:Uncharacterized protein n=1 Tax=Aspergillus heteromorphus CBS 117.55 TaxID=1448321 RepID=A0A317WIQ8_9EURO|nr:uncharacterized protein BO70DRAFT_232876 [Aspergillus heteromorphus CBS 117.55]PWY85057.1 hypothetical protein BO70DRAFT_232876 [Aspergillus heteromorphus CBS 117.55]